MVYIGLNLDLKGLDDDQVLNSRQELSRDDYWQRPGVRQGKYQVSVSEISRFTWYFLKGTVKSSIN